MASLARQPNQHRVYGALGALAIRRGQLDQAERLLHEALELAPTYVEAMSNLGWIQAARGDEAGARSWYEHAIAVDPAYPHVYRRLADLYYDAKDWPHALEYYRRVLAVLPRYFEVLIQAGNTARFAGDHPTAADYYTSAGATRPDSWIPPYNLACLRALDGDRDGAFALLDKAIDLGFATPALLDANEDFETLRGRPAWAAVTKRVAVAHATRRSSNARDGTAARPGA
jgi:tetratricopeptide (TPR) repeat protein